MAGPALPPSFRVSETGLSELRNVLPNPQNAAECSVRMPNPRSPPRVRSSGSRPLT